MRPICIGFLLLPFVSFAQSGDPFTIKGYLKGLPDQSVVEIGNQELDPPVLATAKSKAGRFELKGRLQEANLYTLKIKGADQRLFIFLDAAQITLNGHKDSLAAARVAGSKSHEDFLEFNQKISPQYAKLNKIVEDLNQNRTEDAMEAARPKYMEAQGRINQSTADFVKRHPSSQVSPLAILISTQVNENISETEQLYLQLTPDARGGYYGRSLSKAIAEGKIGTVGTDAIDFVQNDTSGTPVSLASFRGKYVLVDFWASWCRPCRIENPNLVNAYHKFSTKNFTVLGVSLDRAREPWLKAIQDDKLSWTQVSDLKFWSNEAASKYRISSIPQNILIDPTGKIIAKNLRGELLHQKLTEILQ